MQSTATTPEEYLFELADDRREAIETVRETILEHLPEGYTEGMGFGMIAYVVPLDRYPDTYNGQPLMYAALASQKNHMAVYLTSVFADEALGEKFVAEYKATGKKLDMGKSCVRFKSLDHLPLDVIGDAIAALTVDEFIDINEKVTRK